MTRTAINISTDDVKASDTASSVGNKGLEEGNSQSPPPVSWSSLPPPIYVVKHPNDEKFAVGLIVLVVIMIVMSLFIFKLVYLFLWHREYTEAKLREWRNCCQSRRAKSISYTYVRDSDNSPTARVRKIERAAFRPIEESGYQDPKWSVVNSRIEESRVSTAGDRSSQLSSSQRSAGAYGSSAPSRTSKRNASRSSRKNTKRKSKRTKIYEVKD